VSVLESAEGRSDFASGRYVTERLAAIAIIGWHAGHLFFVVLRRMRTAGLSAQLCV
jgi:hypothetical protein